MTKINTIFIAILMVQLIFFFLSQFRLSITYKCLTILHLDETNWSALRKVYSNKVLSTMIKDKLFLLCVLCVEGKSNFFLMSFVQFREMTNVDSLYSCWEGNEFPRPDSHWLLSWVGLGWGGGGTKSHAGQAQRGQLFRQAPFFKFS